MIRFLCTFAVFFCVAVAPSLSYAQRHDDGYNGQANTGYGAIQGANELTLWSGPPIEPKIDPVTYLKKDIPRSLQLRIETLVHGIYMDVPPEYDHYGYEIRRYMARISGPLILGNKSALEGQLTNISNAQIVLRYWQEDMKKEMDAIEEEIENRDAESSIRSKFRYNKAVVYAFLTECQQWITHNKALLEYLVEIDGGYSFNDPQISFNNFQNRKRFISLFKARHAAHEQINEYPPFRMMIY